MEKITAYRCDFCQRIVKTKRAMVKHENKCFKNPLSKSCITCTSLESRGCLNGIPISDHEDLILQFKVEGTFHRQQGVFECDWNELNPEYAYLQNCEFENYCSIKKIRLAKLQTNCNKHHIF